MAIFKAYTAYLSNPFMSGWTASWVRTCKHQIPWRCRTLVGACPLKRNWDLLGLVFIKCTYLKMVDNYYIPKCLRKTTECSLVNTGLAPLSSLKDDSTSQPFGVPVLSFQSRLTPDGLPILTDWINNAQSIWGTGFEGWRESTEVRPLKDDQLGKALGFGDLEAVKGAGRMSILLFTFAYMFSGGNGRIQNVFWLEFGIVGSPLGRYLGKKSEGDAGGASVVFHLLSLSCNPMDSFGIFAME